MAEEILEELVLEEAPAPRKNKKPTKLPKGTKLMVFVAIICIAAFGVTKCIQGSGSDRANVRGMPAPNAEQASRVGFGNEEYNARLEQYSEEKTAQAVAAGKTWVPPISAKPQPIVEEVKPTPEPPKPVPEKPKPKPAPRKEIPRQPIKDASQIQRMQTYLSKILVPPQLESQSVQVLNAPSPIIIASATQPVENNMPGYEPLNAPPLLKPGDILYAMNRITLDSDAPGPSMVEVVSGPYKGAKALGSFVRSGGNLTLQFEGLVMPDGTSYSIKAFAIDPNSDRTAISSSVDNHYIARYGGLIAASFLAGFGDAVGQSGQSSYSNLYGGGYTIPNYDINEELWIAAGRVGEKMSEMFEKNWDIPPTVTLESGTDIGILIISVGRAASAQPAPPQTDKPRNPSRLRGVK